MSTASNSDNALVDLCIAACAEAWRGDGEVLASGMGLVPRLGAGLARLSFSPGLLMNDGECRLVSEPIPVGPRGDYEPKIEGWLPFRSVFDLLWSGKRHAMTMPTQIDRFGASNISVIGDHAKPKVQLLGVRGIPGNTINHPCSFFAPSHTTRTFVENVDMASGVGYEAARWGDGVKQDYRELRRVISNLAVLDFSGKDRSMRVRSVHPGVTIEQVRENTGFELEVAPDCAETPGPTAEQVEIIGSALDPHNLRGSVFAKG